MSPEKITVTPKGSNRRHMAYSVSNFHRRPSIEVHFDIAVAPDRAAWLNMIYELDVDSIDEFDLHIDGLARNGHKVAMPVIHMKRGVIGSYEIGP